MEIVFYLLLVLFLLLLNAFFVLAEFASVKTRPTQMDVLAEEGHSKAKRVQYIQNHLDEFLSVCQVGITLTSIGLGFVGEPAFAKILSPIIHFISGGRAGEAVIHSVTVTVGYLLVSFLHIVIGELVPKSVAIRASSKSALFIAYPILFFRYLFSLPIWLLNRSANLIVKVFRLPNQVSSEAHSEDEIRVILAQTPMSGPISFRRLLHLENILDLGRLSVRNAMRPRRLIRTLRVDAPLSEINETITRFRYSRYPLMGEDPEKPLGFIHVKDLFLSGSVPNLQSLIRPCLKAQENESLEKTLALMQRRANHMTLVYDKNNNWIGMVTLEDAVEEVIGTIEEEFPLEQPLHLFNFLSPDRVVCGVEGATILQAARNALQRLKPGELPMSIDDILRHLAERERLSTSYVGSGLAIPHARLPVAASPVVVVARLKHPLPAPTPVAGDKIEFLFILITPDNEPRIHQILLSHIAGIFESDFFETRLREANTPEQVYTLISTAEQTVLA